MESIVALIASLSGKDLLIAGGWFFTVVGWFIANGQANSRERRKEVRTEVDACCKMAAEILTKSRKYYSTPASDAQDRVLSSEIRFELQRLFVRIERLEKSYPAFEVTNAGVELMDSVTGGDFESASRIVVQPNSDLLLKIESDTHFLIDGLEAGFGRKFK